MTVYNVSSASELQDALSRATGGDEIKLAGGDYGTLSLNSTSGGFSSELKITSADPNDPATFSSLKLNGASNISFDGVNFDYSYSSGEKYNYMPFRLDNCSNISFSNGSLTGDNDDSGYPTGYGFVVRGSSDVTIDNMEISTLFRGLVVDNSQNITVTNNEMYDIKGDGMNFAEVQGVLIEDNYIHDFRSDWPMSQFHRDMIQFWTNGDDSPSTDVVIRGNTLDVGDGVYTQLIFMRNEEVDTGRAGYEMFYKNITIEDNLIYGAHIHGITVGETDGLTIQNNSLIRAETNQDLFDNQDRNYGVSTPRISVKSDSTNVTIDGNLSAGFANTPQSSWNVGDNIVIQDSSPTSPGYYGDIFDINAKGAVDGYNDYDIVPGSIADGAGSSLNYADAGATTPVVEDPVEEPVVPEEPTEPEEPTVPEEPTTGGSDPEPEPGTTDPDPTDSSTPEPDVGGGDSDPSSGGGAGTDDLGGASGFLDAFDDYVLNITDDLTTNDQVKKINDDTHVEAFGDTLGIVFDGKGDSLSLGRLEDFEQSEQLAFTVEFTRDEADGSTQRLVWNHNKIGLTLTDDGLQVHVANNDDKFHRGFSVDDIGLNDTDTHRITVIVDQETDHLQVLVDDILVLEETNTDFDFVGAGGREWGWMLGTPWNRAVDGVVTDFRIDDDINFVDDVVVTDPGVFA